jgi:hypothetical protein
MSRVGDRLRRLERRRRPPQAMYVMYWDDDDIVTHADGRRMTAAEYNRLQPDARVIQLTWGDDDGDVPLTGTFPADIWDNL